MKTELDGRKRFVYGLLPILEASLFELVFIFRLNFDQCVMLVKIIGVSIIVSNNLSIDFAIFVAKLNGNWLAYCDVILKK